MPRAASPQALWLPSPFQMAARAACNLTISHPWLSLSWFLTTLQIRLQSSLGSGSPAVSWCVPCSWAPAAWLPQSLCTPLPQCLCTCCFPYFDPNISPLRCPPHSVLLSVGLSVHWPHLLHQDALIKGFLGLGSQWTKAWHPPADTCCPSSHALLPLSLCPSLPCPVLRASARQSPVLLRSLSGPPESKSGLGCGVQCKWPCGQARASREGWPWRAGCRPPQWVVP
jgi:hypothetical protein